MIYHQILSSNDYGGGELWALRIADELRRRSWPSQIWVPGDGASAREGRARGHRVNCFSPTLLSSSQGRFRAAVNNAALAVRLRREGSGLIHVHSHYAYRMMAHGIAHSGLRSVAHVQLEDSPQNFRWVFQLPPEMIITCARYLVDSVRRALPPPFQEAQWIESVPNAVDTRRFAPGDKRASKHRLGAPMEAPLALMLANLSPHKGQETAIRAVAILKDLGIALHCWMAGTERGGATAHTNRLTGLIAELGVADRVRLLGHRDDADELLRAADFFLLPSRREGLPLSILEAQATRVPVLAAPTAGVPEVVVDHETGFLIAADDAPGYADQIRRLIEEPSLVHRVVERAYARTVAERGWESYGERIMELYQALLDPGRRRPRRLRLPQLLQRAAS